MEILFLAIILILFLLPGLLLSRKQRQQVRATEQFQKNLQVDQRVITAGGLYGTVKAVSENTVDVEIAPGVSVTLDKQGVLRNAERIANQAEVEELPSQGENNVVEPGEDNSYGSGDYGYGNADNSNTGFRNT